MNNLSQNIWQFLGVTVTNPALAAETLLANRQTRDVLWMALLLVAVLSVLMIAALQLLFPSEPRPGQIGVLPFTLCLIVMSMLVMLVFAIYFTGLALGGKGTFPGALVLVIWLQAVLIVLQAIQTMATVTFAPISGAISWAIFALVFWIVVNFINVLHQFDNILRSIFVIVLSMLGLSGGLAFIIAIIGAASGGSANV